MEINFEGQFPYIFLPVPRVRDKLKSVTRIINNDFDSRSDFFSTTGGFQMWSELFQTFGEFRKPISTLYLF